MAKWVGYIKKKRGQGPKIKAQGKEQMAIDPTTKWALCYTPKFISLLFFCGDLKSKKYSEISAKWPANLSG